MKMKNSKQDAEQQNVNGEEGFAGNGAGHDREDGADVNVSDGDAGGSDNSAVVSDDSQQWKDKYMRLSAEFDNYRKRTLKEKMELIASGGEDVIRAVLPVLDDMDRAIDSMKSCEDIEAVRSGVSLISHKLNDMLKSKGLAEIKCMGGELDTDFHEAVARFKSEPENKGKIVDVVQKGYTLKDKVVRHAKVVVGE